MADDVEELRATSRRINGSWDDQTEDYDTTLSRMTALVGRVGALPDRLVALAIPEEADPIIHQQMRASLLAMAAAAEGMLAGLESADTGEERFAQLARYEATASEFGSLAEQVRNSLQSEEAEPG